MTLTFYAVILSTLLITLALMGLLWVYHSTKLDSFLKNELRKYRREPKLGKYKDIEQSFRKDPALGDYLTIEV